MRRCKVCDAILVPEPEIERYMNGEKLEICLSCIIRTVNEIK
jgi:hypothetical protein